MRVARVFSASRWQTPLLQCAATGIFRTNKTAYARTSPASSVEAKKLANQLNYGNEAYSYDGKPAPSFYGYSGYGWGGYPWAGQTIANITSFSYPTWIVPANQPTQEVKIAEGHNTYNLASFFKQCPVPDINRIPGGSIWPGGTDKGVGIYKPSTGEFWDCVGFEGAPHEYQIFFGGYIGPSSPHSGASSLTAHSGIYPYESSEGAWGSHAVGSVLLGGLITAQDMVEVMRGGKIKHALMLGLPATQGPSNKPFTRFDANEFLPEKLGDGITANPAYKAGGKGTDSIAEGGFYCFPATSHPSDFGITKPMEVAVFEAIREYGLVIVDSSGVSTFYVESPLTLGSPYSWAKVNPWAKSGFLEPTYIPKSWTDPTLPRQTQEWRSGTNGVFTKQPWRELEQLEPFLS